ncbi:MAG: ribonuclease PH [Myxococcota bacterium]
MKTRPDGRGHDQPRPISIQTGVMRSPEGSVEYASGETRVLIAASVTEGVPSWMRGEGRGWLTAEYAMHPRATVRRQRRDGRGGSISGRTAEIQRLIGRSLRACVNFEALGERTVHIDCDVLDADGGTRTASITGGYIALALAMNRLRKQGLVGEGVLRAPIVAISAGLVGEGVLLDLCYEEDRDAEVDLNVVGTPSGAIVEVQGTAEGEPIERALFDRLLDRATGAFEALGKAQEEALRGAGVRP